MLLTIFSLIILLFSTVIHEIAHGSVAYGLGDPTAKYSGRLTLNPLKHLDPVGSVLLPVLMFVMTAGRGPIFGWAKPVPVNFYSLRDQKWGIVKVAMAGSATNFLLALIFGLLIRFFVLPQSLFTMFSIISIYNFAWGIFNLIPIPPLDGSHILFRILPQRFLNIKNLLQQYGLVILIFFIFYGINFVFTGARFLYILVSGKFPLY